MPRVPGIDVPRSFYMVTREPAPLAGMEYPRWEAAAWRALSDLGIVHVVSLSEMPITYSTSPLGAPDPMPLQDLFDRGDPRDPEGEERRVRRAAAAVLDWLRAGEGVAVHCDGGTGRTGTVIGCVLRGLGCEAEDVLPYLDRITRARGCGRWPESAWQGSLVRRYEQQGNAGR
jgi:Swiss Army Knife protein, DSP-PTPase phosphatase domain